MCRGKYNQHTDLSVAAFVECALVVVADVSRVSIATKDASLYAVWPDVKAASKRFCIRHVFSRPLFLCAMPAKNTLLQLLYRSHLL